MRYSASSLAKHLQSEEFQKEHLLNLKAIEFWKKLYWRRLDLKMTQDQLAKKASTTQRIISMLENGTYESNPSQEMTSKLSEAIKISI